MTSAMRGRQAQSNLGTLRRLHPDTAARLRERHPEVVSAIDQSGALDWLDFSVAATFFDTTYEALGHREFRRYCVQSMSEALQGPMLRALWDSSVRLFGTKPDAILRWSPQVWSMIYRDVGELEWDTETQQVRLRDVSAAAWRARGFIESVAGAIDTVFDLCGTPLTSHVDTSTHGLLEVHTRD
jgi:hypothetical protein